MPKDPRFFPKHNWEALYLEYRDWIQAAKGTDGDFMKLHQIPRGSFIKHGVAFKARIRAEGGLLPEVIQPTGYDRGGGINAHAFPTLRQRRSAAAPGSALETIQDAAPAMARRLIELAESNVPTAASAVKSALEIAGIRPVEQSTASPYSVMTDAELEARALQLWPQVKQERVDESKVDVEISSANSTPQTG